LDEFIHFHPPHYLCLFHHDKLHNRVYLDCKISHNHKSHYHYQSKMYRFLVKLQTVKNKKYYLASVKQLAHYENVSCDFYYFPL